MYVFLINGLDPLECANLRGVRDHLQTLGFTKTFYGQLYHGYAMKQELRRLHEEDPAARFVLIGFSFGANVARSMTRAVKEDGIQIDLLVYVSGNTMQNVPRDRPENAGLIVNITATELIRNGAWLDNAENANVQDARHFAMPTHPYTIRTLDRELTVLAARVPAMQTIDSDSLPPTAGEEPTPRPVMPRTTGRRDEWDFLKPISHLPPGGASPIVQQTRLSVTATN